MIRGYRVPIMQQDPNSGTPSVSRGIDVLRQDGTWPTRDLRDVDVTVEGVIKRRPGYRLSVPTPQPAHSLYYYAGKMVYAYGTDWIADSKVVTQVSSPVVYTPHFDKCFGAYDEDILYFDHTFAVRKTSSHAPPPKFQVAPKESSSVVAGDVGVAVSYLDAYGTESAARFLGVFPKKAGTSLAVTNVPMDTSKKLVVYATVPDGDVLRMVSETPAVFPHYRVTDTPEGRLCDTLDRAPMPGGHLITSHGARLCVANGSYLVFSDEFCPHLCMPGKNIIPFAGTIRLLHSLGPVLFVADDLGLWALRGVDALDFKKELASGASVVKYSQVEVPGSAISGFEAPPGVRVLVFATTQGFCIATEDGNVRELHSDRVALREGLEGRSFYYRNEGVRQVVCLTRAVEVFPQHLANNY